MIPVQKRCMINVRGAWVASLASNQQIPIFNREKKCQEYIMVRSMVVILDGDGFHKKIQCLSKCQRL